MHDAESHTPPAVWTWDAENRGRDTVIRGRAANQTWGEPEQQVRERHAPSDFDGKTRVMI